MTRRLNNADRLQLDTPRGWHAFVPLHHPIVHLGALWRCAGCYGIVPSVDDWHLLGPRCREMLTAIPQRTSDPHDPPPPPGRLF